MDRHEAREFVLGLLYQRELTDDDNAETALQEADLGEQRSFAESLYRGVRQRLSELDRLLSTRTHGWRYERLSIVDRNILRLAAFELLFLDEIPAEVAIDEAVELCKSYGTDRSPTFVNGILDRLWKEQNARDGDEDPPSGDVPSTP
ncbi:MAG: transcription antitermination factor NusB [Candidatus Bipolaricaulota bacterium]|nr:MAG: transcription antitermination factor NusB [Candidatus Bipolaricaulota bacterium]